MSPSNSASQQDNSKNLINALKIQKIVTLPDGERGKITSIYTYSDKLLLGLSNGSLLVYLIDDPLSTSETKLTLEKHLKNFSPRSIDQIGVLKDTGSIVILSDSVVSLYDIDTYSLDETLKTTKGTTTFAISFGVDDEIDEEGSSPMTTITRLVIGCKRKLICYEWIDSEFNEVKDIILPDRVKSLSFFDHNIAVCGLSSDYCIIDIARDQISNIALPGSHSHYSFTSVGISYIGIGGRYPFPFSTTLPDKTALLVKDTTSQFVNKEGQLLERPAIPLSSPLESIGFSYPYLVCIFSKHIEVRNPFTTTLLQTIDLQGVKFINEGKFCCVVSNDQVYRLSLSSSLKTQIKTLADKHLLDEAISILESVDSTYIVDDNKDSILRDLKILKAIDMLRIDKDFQGSLQLFSQVSAPPKTVVGLFPSQVSGTGEDLIQYMESLVKTRSLHSRNLSALSNIPPSSSSSAATSLADSNKSSKHAKKSAPSSGSNSPSSNQAPNTISQVLSSSSETSSGSDNRRHTTSTIKAEWTDAELSAAVNALVTFLADTRRKISSISSNDGPVRDPVSGLVLTSDIYEEEEEIEIVEEVEEKLDPNGGPEDKNADNQSQSDKSSTDDEIKGPPIIPKKKVVRKEKIKTLNKAAELVDTTMFKCYIIQNPALIGPLLRIHNHCNPDTVKTVLSHLGKWKELIDFYFGKKLHRQALELLRKLAGGEYICNSNEDDSASTKSQRKHKKGKSISSHIHATNVPSYLKGPEPTVQYLKRLNNDYLDLIFEFGKWPISQNESFGEDLFLDDSSESESLERPKVLRFLERLSYPCAQSLTIKYLEYIIFEKEETAAYFHTKLALNYLKSMITKSKSLDPKVIAESEKLFDKLVLFLKEKDSRYRVEKVLSAIPDSDTECTRQELEIKAILYGKEGKVREALMIYTFSLMDDTKARAFCADVYDENTVLGRHALHTLMALYLTPPEATKFPQRLDLALDLLASQGSRMSVVEIINTLPSDTKIHDIAIFLTSQIRTLRASWNNAQIDTALRKVDLVKAQEELYQRQQKSVTITNLKTCRVCFKRLGHSVISVFPDGTAIHYGCARAYQKTLDEEKEKKLNMKNKKKLLSKKKSAELSGSFGDSLSSNENRGGLFSHGLNSGFLGHTLSKVASNNSSLTGLDTHSHSSNHRPMSLIASDNSSHKSSFSNN